MIRNEYLPFASEILDVIPYTKTEYTFRMSYRGEVKPGQFFEVSIPKYGEAPISVSGIGKDYIDFTIRRVGRVTGEIFENGIGSSLFLRGPYGNGFDVTAFRDRDLAVVAGGTGVSPVRGVVEYFYQHPEECRSLTAILGFKSPDAILFAEDIARWKSVMNIILTVDSAPEGSAYQVGLVTKYIPDLHFRDMKETAGIVVGPPAMMRFSVKGLLGIGMPEENIWISQERRMCCGLGKCGHCKIGNTYVCLDGPVFNYTEGKSLID